MAPLITLVVVTFGLLVLGAIRARPLRRVPTALRGGLAVMFMITGISHFVGMREELIAMVPGVVPSPEIAVTLTGVAELAGAIGLLIPHLALPAASGLALLLIGMFPANVGLALSNEPLPWYDHLLWRTLIQLVFLTATTTVIIDQYRTWRLSRGFPRHPPLESSSRGRGRMRRRIAVERVEEFDGRPRVVPDPPIVEAFDRQRREGE